jgi:hypothetical protein
MSSFKEFISEIESSPDKALSSIKTSLPATIELALTSSIVNVLSPLSEPIGKKQKFSENVSSLIRNQVFISELSEQIGIPSEGETEDSFVENSSRALRRMLYSKFDIKE